MENKRFVTACNLPSDSPVRCEQRVNFQVHSKTHFRAVRTRFLCRTANNSCPFSEVRPVEWLGKMEHEEN